MNEQENKKIEYEKKIYLNFTCEELEKIIKNLSKKINSGIRSKLELAHARYIITNEQYNGTDTQRQAQEKIQQMKIDLGIPNTGTKNDAYETAVWKLKGGNEIPISLMEDEHLVNSIKLIKRNLARRCLLEDKSKMSPKQYLSLMQYDALCYHAKKRGLLKKGLSDEE